MQSVPTHRWEQLVNRDAKSMDGANLGEMNQIGPPPALETSMPLVTEVKR